MADLRSLVTAATAAAADGGTRGRPAARGKNVDNSRGRVDHAPLGKRLYPTVMCDGWDGNVIIPPAEKRFHGEKEGPAEDFGEMSAKDIFQRFFTDDVLNDIVDFTSENYRKKKAAEPGKHKIKWS